LRAAGRIRALLSSRAKHPEEVRSKIRRKRDESERDEREVLSFGTVSSNMNLVLTDLAGVRVVVYDPRDEDRVFELVQRKLRVCDLPKAVEKKDAPNKNYRASHVLVAVDDGFDRATIRDTIVEVQIVSIANHVFNELEHDIDYKSHGVAPTPSVSSALNDVLHASRLLDSVVARLLDERAASVRDAETRLSSDEELRFTLERLVGHPLLGDFTRLFRLLNASLDPLTPATIRELGGGPQKTMGVGYAQAKRDAISCTEDVTAYALGLQPDLGHAFSAVAKGWRGPPTELKRAVLGLKAAVEADAVAELVNELDNAMLDYERGRSP